MQKYLVRVETTEYASRQNLIKIEATSGTAALLLAVNIERERISGFTKPGFICQRRFIAYPRHHDERIVCDTLPVRHLEN